MAAASGTTRLESHVCPHGSQILLTVDLLQQFTPRSCRLEISPRLSRGPRRPIQRRAPRCPSEASPGGVGALGGPFDPHQSSAERLPQSLIEAFSEHATHPPRASGADLP